MDPYQDGLNKLIEDKSKELFKLDEITRKVISFIAKNGPSTVYVIEKVGKIRRQSIYRRLRGEKDLVGLLDQEYLFLEKTEKFSKIEGLLKKSYGLTFKGLLASLSNMRFERTYLGKSFFDMIQVKGGQQVRIATENYIKAELAFWFHLNLKNGLTLTNLRAADRWYQETRRHLFSSAFHFHDWDKLMLMAAEKRAEINRKLKNFVEKHGTEAVKISEELDRKFFQLYKKEWENAYLRIMSVDETSNLEFRLRKQTEMLNQELDSLDDELADHLFVIIGYWPSCIRFFYGLDFSKLTIQELFQIGLGLSLDNFNEEKDVRRFIYPYRLALTIKDDVFAGGIE
jgi:hypothetical protein